MVLRNTSIVERVCIRIPWCTVSLSRRDKLGVNFHHSLTYCTLLRWTHYNMTVTNPHALPGGGGGTTPTCDHGLARRKPLRVSKTSYEPSWKVKAMIDKKKQTKIG